MEPKQSEKDFAHLMGVLHNSTNGAVWSHKWADMRKCPTCGSLLYKVDDNVDYTVIVGFIAGLVECKQDDVRFSYADEEIGIRPKQRDWLNEWQRLGRPCFIFLELGDGSAPKDRNAWLIPWVHWLMIESRLEQAGKKSLAWRQTRQSKELNAVNLLNDYQLNWKKGSGKEKGYFEIPESHIFWNLFQFNPPV